MQEAEMKVPKWWLDNCSRHGTPAAQQRAPEPQPEPAPVQRSPRTILRATADVEASRVQDEALARADALIEGEVERMSLHAARYPGKPIGPDDLEIKIIKTPMPDFWAWRAPGNRFVQPHKQDRQLLSHQIRR